MHNGNGTAETVRWLQPHIEEENFLSPYNFGSFSHPRYKPWFDEADSKNVLFVSVHGYGPRERGLDHLLPAAAFYPGSGVTSLPENKYVELNTTTTTTTTTTVVSNANDNDKNETTNQEDEQDEEQ